MTVEIGLLIANIIAIIIMAVYIFSLERERKRRQDQWEVEVFNMMEKVQKKLDMFQIQLSKMVSDDFQRVDENMQKRHNYLKKSYNDLADRIDVVEQTAKGVKDLYYQFERIHTGLNELIALMPKSTSPSKVETKEPETPQLPVLDEDIAKVINMYRSGMPVEEIAQSLGKAIPEVQLTLHIFSEHL